MAVQKRRKTRSRRNMRRSHDKLTDTFISVDPVSGENHRRHHITKGGYYRGRQVIEPRNETYYEDDDE